MNKQFPRFQKDKYRQDGFTLIEVLIAVLVLSVGLLGLAGLGSIAHKFTHSAYLRTQAAYLAYGIVDSMRANKTHIANYAGKYETPTSGCNIAFERPDTGSIAADDLAEWQNQIACTLPEATGEIVINPATGALTIFMTWDQYRVEYRKEGETAPLAEFHFETKL